MELTRPGYAVVYVILLCALAQGGSEGKRAEDEDFLKDVVLSSSSSSHAEQGYIVWKNCRKELTERNNDAKDFDFQAQLRSSDKRSTFLIENNINKASKLLPPQLIKNNIVGCLRISACPHAPISELRASSRHQLVSGRGRYLISEEQSSADAPSLALEPSSSDDDGDRDHDFILPQNIFEPSPLSLSPPPPPHKANLHVAASPGNNNGSGNQQTAIIVAGVVSGITMVVGMLLCYRVVKEGRVENESGSLLALTSKDYTGGPPKVVHLGDVDSKYSKEESTIENVMGNEKSTSTVKISISKVEDNINILLVETTSSEAVEKVAPPPAAKPPPPLLGPPAAPPPPALAPRPPPPPRAGHPPPAPPKAMIGKKQLEPKEGDSSDGDAAKPKLKPFFWDKVTAKPDQSMVWHEISGGSFVFNEEKMESLFGCANQNRPERKKDSPSLDNTVHYIQIIDPKKAQNLSILLRALNVTTNEVVDALKEGNKLPFELIQTLLKMAPSAEEELKLRLFTGDLSQLGPAERFLKVLVDIPFAFKRLESLMFMFIFPEETTSIKDCFATLEVACNKLRKSRLFLKLLEAVLKTGNRMNDGTYRGGAQAFRLDTLLKLSDVKGTDGKTTLLHFVVQEIIRSEGIRAARTAKESNSSMSSVKTEDIDYDVEQTAEHYRSLGLQVVSGLSTELDDVKKAAIVDGDALSSAVSKLHLSLTKTQEFLNTDLKNIEEDSEFQRCIERFVETAKSNVAGLVDEDKRIMALVKSTADYFHGNAGKDEGLRLFLTVRDFLIILDKVCKEVNEASVKAAKASMKKDTSSSSVSSSPDTRQQSSPTTELHKRLFPAIAERRVDYDSSSDDDS